MLLNISLILEKFINLVVIMNVRSIILETNCIRSRKINLPESHIR